MTETAPEDEQATAATGWAGLALRHANTLRSIRIYLLTHEVDPQTRKELLDLLNG